MSKMEFLDPSEANKFKKQMCIQYYRTPVWFKISYKKHKIWTRDILLRNLCAQIWACFHGSCPLGRGRHNVKILSICAFVAARYFDNSGFVDILNI